MAVMMCITLLTLLGEISSLVGDTIVCTYHRLGGAVFNLANYVA